MKIDLRKAVKGDVYLTRGGMRMVFDKKIEGHVYPYTFYTSDGLTRFSYRVGGNYSYESDSWSGYDLVRKVVPVRKPGTVRKKRRHNHDWWDARKFCKGTRLEWCKICGTVRICWPGKPVYLRPTKEKHES
jgi:hypothetical protein